MPKDCICGDPKNEEAVKKRKVKTCSPACCNVFNKDKNVKAPTICRCDQGYLEHRKRLPIVIHGTDNRPPLIRIDSLLKSSKISGEYYRINAINRDNENLLKRINITYRTKGVVDCFNMFSGKSPSKLKNQISGRDRYERENLFLLYRLLNARTILRIDDFEKEWQYRIKQMRGISKYPLILPGLVNPGYDQGVAYGDCMDEYRPKVFLDISVKNGRTIGRLTILLFSDVVPKSVNNFLELIKNYKRSTEDKKLVHYVDSPVHRIFKNLYAATGDMIKGNGTGGRSASGKDFKAENYIIPVEYIGTVAMVVDENGMVNSMFIITFKPISLLNGTVVVIGRVIKGINVLEAMEASARQNGVPREKIIISNNGILRPLRDFPRRCQCVPYANLIKEPEKIKETIKEMQQRMKCQKWRCFC